MKWLENLTGGYSSSAKVVNDTLVLSLPDAKSPVVWRMELAEIKEAAFELQQKDTDYLLVMKTPKGASREIAPFDNRAKALKALMSTSQAMEHAETLSRSNDDGNAVFVSQGSRKERSGQALAGIIGIIILGGLLFLLTQIGPNTPQYAASGGLAATGSSTGSAPNSAGSPGVPVSADDFLMQR